MHDPFGTLPELGALRSVPYMGVIYDVAEAVKLGFENGHPDWCNLGQGQPEVGEMRGAPARILDVHIDPSDCDYGPLQGMPELGARVAETYNRPYRKGKRSQYGPEHVAIASGGRLALTRAMAALGHVEVGYQLPDYTADEDMLNLHLDRLTPIALRGREVDGFAVTAERLRQEIEERDLAAYVFSNPYNPTGNVVRGDELEAFVDLARNERTTLFSDEFYSHFNYEPGPNSEYTPGAGPVSAAEFAEDCDEDPVLIFDGLTKSQRYPGWRIGWMVGPPVMVETTARTASSIDDGPSRIAQRSLAGLPEPFNEGMSFFRRALEHKVMTVPGEFFDVNPGKRRRGTSPYRQWMRFSFGPPMDNLVMGLDRLERMLKG